MVPTEKFQFLPTIHSERLLKNKSFHNLMAYCSDNCKILIFKLWRDTQHPTVNSFSILNLSIIRKLAFEVSSWCMLHILLMSTKNCFQQLDHWEITWLLMKSMRVLHPRITISSNCECSKSVRTITNKLLAKSGLWQLPTQSLLNLISCK